MAGAAVVNQAPSRTRSEILPLTSLRFVAALWVFVFHIDMRWPLNLGLLDPLVKHGAVGMSLFFILSGFVLGYSFSGQSIQQYARNRVARIYPVYTLAAVVTLPFIAGGAADAPSIAQVLVLVVAHVLMLQAWFPQLFNLWNFSGSWSLSAEAFFYAVFPFARRGIEKLQGRALVAFIGAIYVLSVLPGTVWFLFRTPGMMFYSMPIFRLPEFLMGVAVATLYGRGVRVSHPRLVALTSAAALAGFLTLLGPRTAIYVTANVVAVPAIALLIFSLSQTQAMSWRPLVILGRASYAFYSMQVFLLLFMMERQRGQAPWEAWTVLGWSFVILTAISLLTFYLVEEPARRMLGRGRVRVDAGGARAPLG